MSKTDPVVISNPTDHFLAILKYVWESGEECAPRGLKIKEVRNFQYTFPGRVRFMSFDHRKFNLDYAKQEFLWYIGADKSDLSIGEVASMWKSLVNTDGTINSNYGWYLFNPQAVGAPNEEAQHTCNFLRAASELEKDPDSRRAVVTILTNDQLNSVSKDYPCTYALNFHIRDNQLHLMVRMRSNDAIYGLGNDAPAFSFVHELMWVTLTRKYPQLKLGEYNHVADSMHIYEKHFEMVEKILADPRVSVDPHRDCPHMRDPDTLNHLRSAATHVDVVKTHALQGRPMHELVSRWPALGDPFTRWLVTRDNPQTLLGGKK